MRLQRRWWGVFAFLVGAFTVAGGVTALLPSPFTFLGTSFGTFLEKSAEAAEQTKGRSPAVSAVGISKRNARLAAHTTQVKGSIGLGVPSHAEFLKLKPTQQTEVIRSMRKFLLDYERTVGKNFADTNSNEISQLMALVNLFAASNAGADEPEADADAFSEVNGGGEVPAASGGASDNASATGGIGCFFAGWWVQGAATKCNKSMVQNLPSYNSQNLEQKCGRNQIRCNDFLFGPGVCIPGNSNKFYVTSICFGKAGRSSLENARKYAGDPSRSSDWANLKAGLEGVCSNSKKPRKICTRLKERLTQIQSGIGALATNSGDTANDDDTPEESNSPPAPAAAGKNEKPANTPPVTESKNFCCKAEAVAHDLVRKLEWVTARCASEFGNDASIDKNSSPLVAVLKKDLPKEVNVNEIYKSIQNNKESIFCYQVAGNRLPDYFGAVDENGKPKTNKNGQFEKVVLTVGCKLVEAPVTFSSPNKKCDNDPKTENFKPFCIAPVKCEAISKNSQVEDEELSVNAACGETVCKSLKIGNSAQACLLDSSIEEVTTAQIQAGEGKNGESASKEKDTEASGTN